MNPLRTCRARVGAALSIAFMAAAAHAMPQPSRADPADPQAAVPAVSYRSPLREYQRIGEQPVGDWRALNDRVRAIGGWRAYAREANTPDDADKARVAPPSKDAPPRDAQPAAPAAHGHGGHAGPSKKEP